MQQTNVGFSLLFHEYFINIKSIRVRSGKLLLALASTVLVSESRGIHSHILLAHGPWCRATPVLIGRTSSARDVTLKQHSKAPVNINVPSGIRNHDLSWAAENRRGQRNGQMLRYPTIGFQYPFLETNNSICPSQECVSLGLRIAPVGSYELRYPEGRFTGSSAVVSCAPTAQNGRMSGSYVHPKLLYGIARSVQRLATVWMAGALGFDLRLGLEIFLSP
jgi:hypothetical protein